MQAIGPNCRVESNSRLRQVRQCTDEELAHRHINRVGIEPQCGTEFRGQNLFRAERVNRNIREGTPRLRIGGHASDAMCAVFNNKGVRCVRLIHDHLGCAIVHDTEGVLEDDRPRRGRERQGLWVDRERVGRNIGVPREHTRGHNRVNCRDARERLRHDVAGAPRLPDRIKGQVHDVACGRTCMTLGSTVTPYEVKH